MMPFVSAHIRSLWWLSVRCGQGVVQLFVEEAKDLRDADLPPAGTSDPYCQITGQHCVVLRWLFYRAMLCMRSTSHGPVSVCLSVCLSVSVTSRHSKSSVCRWYTQLVRVYDTYRTVEATRSRHGWVHMFITHRPTVTLLPHNFDLFRTCRTSSFSTVAWQLARFQLTRRIARSLLSWAVWPFSCN